MDSAAVQSTTEGRAAATAGRVRFAGLACLAGGALELVSVPFGFPSTSFLGYSAPGRVVYIYLSSCFPASSSRATRPKTSSGFGA